MKISVWLKADTKPRYQEGQMASTYLGISVIHLTVTEIQIIMREFIDCQTLICKGKSTALLMKH